MCVCVWCVWKEVGLSLQCPDHCTAIWYFITVLYPDCLSCSCASQYYIFVLYCKFSLVSECVNRGNIHVHMHISVPFFRYADLLVIFDKISGKSRTLSKRKTKSYSCKFIYFVQLELYWTVNVCVPRTRQRLVSHLDWVDLPSIYSEGVSYRNHSSHCRQTCTDNFEGKGFYSSNILPKKDWEKGHKEMRSNCSQIYTTWIFLVFLHIVSYFLFTYLKIPPGIHIFSRKSLSFFMYCRQSGILDVHLLCTSNYCDFLLLCQA